MIKKFRRKNSYILDNLDDYHPIRKHIKILDDRRVISRRKIRVPVKIDRRKNNRRSE